MGWHILPTNTAVIIQAGPFYDAVDGVTPKPSLVITDERISLSAETYANSAPTYVLDNIAGATSGTSNDLNYITNGDNAMMQIELSAANLNRFGFMRLTITNAAAHVPVWEDILVVPLVIFNWFVQGTDLADVSVTQWLGTAVTAATAGIPDTNVKNIDNDAASASGTVTFPAATLASTTNITAGTITTATNVTNAPTSGDLTATMKASVTTAATAATPTIASVSGAVGSVTGNVGGNVTGSVGSVVGAVGSVTGAVGSVTGNVGGNVVGSVGSVAGAVGSVTGAVGGNLGGNVLGSVVGAVGSVTGSVGGNVVGTVASVVGAVASVTGNVGGNVVGSVGSLATQAKADVNAELAALLTATIADSIPADGTRPSIANGIYMLVQFMFERSVSSTTLTVKKANGATALMTFTLDSATLPTSITRTT